MGLSVLAVVVIWFITGFIINYLFENDENDLTKRRFHLATALQIMVHIIAVLLVLAIIFS